MKKKLFYEFNHVVNVFKIRVHEWQKNCTKIKRNGVKFSRTWKYQNIGLKNIPGIIEYALVTSNINIIIERTFST